MLDCGGVLLSTTRWSRGRTVDSSNSLKLPLFSKLSLDTIYTKDQLEFRYKVMLKEFHEDVKQIIMEENKV